MENHVGEPFGILSMTTMHSTAKQSKGLSRHHYYRITTRQGKGDHEIWYSPLTERRFVVDNSIKSRHTANAVLKQVGLSKAF
jgi:hypothetical protein